MLQDKTGRGNVQQVVDAPSLLSQRFVKESSEHCRTSSFLRWLCGNNQRAEYGGDPSPTYKLTWQDNTSCRSGLRKCKARKWHLASPPYRQCGPEHRLGRFRFLAMTDERGRKK